MITAGIDVGARSVKVVLLSDGRPLAHRVVPAGFDVRSALRSVLSAALEEAGLEPGALAATFTTGAGRKEVADASDTVTEVTAAARGACFLFPAARTVVDVGAEEARAVRCTVDGRVEDFAVNDKCAAGAGTFIEAMARVLEVSVEELGQMALRSSRAVPMSSQCAVFAESEVVSLLHARTPKEDIARAIHDSIASRTSSLVRRVGFVRELVLAGGMARNLGFVAAMRRALGTEVLVPEDPELVGALGAALIAAERAVAAVGER